MYIFSIIQNGLMPDDNSGSPEWYASADGAMWYDSVVDSVAGDDPALRDAVINLLEENAGTRTDGNDDYTYYGLPAAGASSDMFEEWD